MTKYSDDAATTSPATSNLLNQTATSSASLQSSSSGNRFSLSSSSNCLKGNVISCDELSKADLTVKNGNQRETTVLQKPALAPIASQLPFQPSTPVSENQKAAIMQASQLPAPTVHAEVVPSQPIVSGLSTNGASNLVAQVIPQANLGTSVGDSAPTIHFPTQISVPTFSGCGPLPIMRHPNDTNGVTSRSTTVPEFLYQLVKMLAEDNKEVIEWVNGNIMVHNPHKLASHVLGKYFRHSKYASFQRQLNYFGFRKISGKGKMAPCSYVNDEVTTDIRSLLSIKRKPHGATGGRGKANQTTNKERRAETDQVKRTIAPGQHPLMNNLNVVNSVTDPPQMQQGSESGTGPNTEISQNQQHQSSLSDPKVNLPANSLSPPSALAQAAVGRGVKHCLNGYLKPGPSSNSAVTEAQRLNLLELQKNFQKSSEERKSDAASGSIESPDMVSSSTGERNVFAGGIREESIASLVDLAMIPQAPISSSGDIIKSDSEEKQEIPSSEKLTFIDFPAGEGAWADAFGWSQSAQK